MKISKLRDLSVTELEEQLRTSKTELFNLRFQQATNQLDNPMRIVEVKKTIARINTLLKEDALKAAK
ncbi:MAG: 50S ribosomal protein L29 [Clostridiales bacterium]|jgi:large subunit ribosomal protein L29|nr:50S ribosomal protein L29 [Clostridiales bacterium]